MNALAYGHNADKQQIGVLKLTLLSPYRLLLICLLMSQEPLPVQSTEKME